MWDNDIPMEDFGAVPKIFVNGLARVIPMGDNALFTFYTLRFDADGAHRIAEVELVAPVEAVGPAFDLAINALGARTLVTMAGHAITSAVRRKVLPM